MKIIFVTGGIVSGLGKGIFTSSIGKLLSSCGYDVGVMKMDPYLQVDAGTMSPYEHGEVFVTEDGAETDLDIGNYERFIGKNLSKSSSITTGRIYLEVIEKERKGEFLGKTVQIVPHITNAIKEKIYNVAKNHDITIVEIGGTAGDIEAAPFLEALRQIGNDIGRKNVCYTHVVPLIHLEFSGELKTKPIQHAVRELLESGINADFLLCRTSVKIPDELLNKISQMCSVNKNNIIEGRDVDTIYKVPEKLREQNLHTKILEYFNLEKREPDLQKWNYLAENIKKDNKQIHIAIVGKYTYFTDTYKSIIESLLHAGANLDRKIILNWIDSEKLTENNYEKFLQDEINSGKLDGILVPGGFGQRGVEGMILAAKFAREKDIPYLGICLGMQVAVIEFARNVCNISNANSSEFGNFENSVIDIMQDQKNIENKGGTMRVGSFPAVLENGSLVSQIYNSENISERHRHRYEVNLKYLETLEKNGLKLSGKSPDSTLVEFIENPKNKFFVATQAHPEFKSSLENPHPLFKSFLENCEK